MSATNLPDNASPAKKPKGNQGRKTGSTDSVYVSIETLLKYLKPETVIPLRRKFAEQIEAVHQIKFVNETAATETAVSQAVFAEENAAAKADTVRVRLEIQEETL